MILDSIMQIDKYGKLHPGFSIAFNYLKNQDLASLPSGKHLIHNDKIYASVDTPVGKGIGQSKLEVHQKFIDIQCIVSGVDNIGWKPLSKCKIPESEYNSEKDIQFFTDIPETWFGLSPGNFAIFFPTDAHAPLAMNGKLNKIVIKIAYSW
jgi:YhcH/YjgK/YiaL family protein